MTNALKIYIERYTELELGMQELIRRKGNSLCAQCSCICCDAVMCIEGIKSPFLKLVHQQADEYDEKNGFLSSTGCSLKKGRPSVCYEYFCDDHFYYQPDDLHADVLKTTGSLLYHATHSAKDEIPIDEILTEEALNLLDLEGFENHLVESLKALEIIRAFYRDGTISESEKATLKRIQTPKEF